MLLLCCVLLLCDAAQLRAKMKDVRRRQACSPSFSGGGGGVASRAMWMPEKNGKCRSREPRRRASTIELFIWQNWSGTLFTCQNWNHNIWTGNISWEQHKNETYLYSCVARDDLSETIFGMSKVLRLCVPFFYYYFLFTNLNKHT